MAGARLLVSCRYCHRPVALVDEVDQAVITVMAIHLQRVHRQAGLGEHSSAEAILPHFRITPADSGNDPPDAA